MHLSFLFPVWSVILIFAKKSVSPPPAKKIKVFTLSVNLYSYDIYLENEGKRNLIKPWGLNSPGSVSLWERRCHCS